MLTRRCLTFSDPQALPDGPVLRREILEQNLLASQLLEAARSNAESILAQARRQSAQLADEAREQARAEVWRQADALLNEWQQQRQQMWTDIIASAETLVSEAMQCLLGETVQPERIKALLRQLAAAQPSDEAGVLHCHPAELDAVSHQLQTTQALWSVRADPQLPPDSLCLRTALGDFSLSWGALVAQVWPLPRVPAQSVR
ncbi:type III secretion system stator protein SctL [Pseudomonas sp. 13B_3.2_Bac1]|uniref:type III secretion system stator protein SctL n=1 Tax=Pseudomonas sp. 13B_3.2_Bac1 TaxID=2971623 RepID=UPI0021C5D36F|nr:type III secretion system stator protein SctL [Pseudomonas sp. 13B_3.2_Bac1]MCU1771343.1 type III secretion system stator protein SctL [Pseudomonas sp. 13B_3.2_Bac1]